MLAVDLINWAMFLAVWIALAQQISSSTSFCSTPGGGNLTTAPCNTIYAALAFAIVCWLLFSISCAMTIKQMMRENRRGGEKETNGEQNA